MRTFKEYVAIASPYLFPVDRIRKNTFNLICAIFLCSTIIMYFWGQYDKVFSSLVFGGYFFLWHLKNLYLGEYVDKYRIDDDLVLLKRWGYARDAQRSLNKVNGRTILSLFILFLILFFYSFHLKTRLVRDFDPQMVVDNQECFAVLDGLEPLFYNQDGWYAAVTAKEIVLTEDCQMTLMSAEGPLERYARGTGYMTIFREPDGVVIFYHRENMADRDIMRLIEKK